MGPFAARDVPRGRALLGLGLAALLCGTAAATEVYVTYDKEGRPQYSDRPQPGTQKVEVTPAQTYEAPKQTASAAPPVTPPAQRAAPGPACRIVSPLQDEVFLNVESLTITAIGPPRATPSLLLNGNVIASEDGMPVFTIKPIPRGTYTATVTFSGGTAGAVCRTATVTFHVRQPSVIRPAAQPRSNAGR